MSVPERHPSGIPYRAAVEMLVFGRGSRGFGQPAPSQLDRLLRVHAVRPVVVKEGIARTGASHAYSLGADER
jgi:hypothetical protein